MAYSEASQAKLAFICRFFWHILFRRRIEERLLQTGASLVQQGITKSQHQVIWWLPFTHEGCLGLGL
jgi:hypothetical protein